MIAYDIPFSALFYIVYAGMPVEEYIFGPNKEESDQLIAKLRKAYEEGYD